MNEFLEGFLKVWTGFHEIDITSSLYSLGLFVGTVSFLASFVTVILVIPHFTVKGFKWLKNKLT